MKKSKMKKVLERFDVKVSSLRKTVCDLDKANFDLNEENNRLKRERKEHFDARNLWEKRANEKAANLKDFQVKADTIIDQKNNLIYDYEQALKTKEATIDKQHKAFASLRKLNDKLIDENKQIMAQLVQNDKFSTEQTLEIHELKKMIEDLKLKAKNHPKEIERIKKVFRDQCAKTRELETKFRNLTN